jgi:hypothetical protein
LNLSPTEEKQEQRLTRRRSASASRADLFYLLNSISFVQLFLMIEDVSTKPISVVAVAVSIRVAHSAPNAWLVPEDFQRGLNGRE